MGHHVRVLRPGDEPAVDTFLAAHADASLFLRRNLLVSGLVDGNGRYQGAWAGAFEDGRLVAVAQHTRFGSILVQAPLHAAAVVHEATRASGRPVGGFIGPRAQTLVARTALGFDSAPLRMESHEGLYVLQLDALVVPDLLTSGRAHARPSTPADLDLLVRWRAEYRIEANADDDGPALLASSRDDVETSLAEGSGWVLEMEGAPVAYQQFNAMLSDVVQVGGVWTPPPLRNRGYARAVVAGALRAVRAAGVHRSVLFTGETNLPARRSYAALGFTRVGEWALIFLRIPARPLDRSTTCQQE
jgi:RimJ/RimL family protein N-acetyltransferase